MSSTIDAVRREPWSHRTSLGRCCCRRARNRGTSAPATGELQVRWRRQRAAVINFTGEALRRRPQLQPASRSPGSCRATVAREMGMGRERG
uniref:Uncharacterized protein n=1 Tax=Oryza nivara TaxID=4536 RepID=A0A0E0FKP5_ORYNI